ncbi:MAG: type II toxin-antitoxin system RelE/ParE family toxin [Nitrospirae bacterium]|uniref:type II toxin-antitoxin system RelE/ParE family toxin n=1 Tax=Candidatus Magnetobacterium casense TaxID=1455061 RepID=UPI00059110EA|nr:type II toxin-antitoxin system RelE/ParE family toxin [Candidatus Magnetobacterium casensis]MBF0338348.1 type II toxin-antitoxin system RelE/ParE family toxin [Nitrospirota bacterium]
MEASNKRIRIYDATDGKEPFRQWLDSLKDIKGQAKVKARIDRLSLGNFGDCRAIKSGVYELRIDYGPGYRVYFGEVGSDIILLLCGGDKTHQEADIKKALIYWDDFMIRRER